jgi:hypothetical protein
MPPFVVDASMTLSWRFLDEATPYSRAALAALQTTYAVVPALWPFEIANGLAIAERRKRINLSTRFRASHWKKRAIVSPRRPAREKGTNAAGPGDGFEGAKARPGIATRPRHATPDSGFAPTYQIPR